MHVDDHEAVEIIMLTTETRRALVKELRELKRLRAMLEPHAMRTPNVKWRDHGGE